jgi:hypothetical protein
MMTEDDQLHPPSFNPVKFFGLQFLCIMGWLLTLGAVAFVIVSEDNMLMVLQGWGMSEPHQIEI